MTEHEWLNAVDPRAMLEFLQTNGSDRKLRLFAVACSRRVWGMIDELGRAAVETAERFADGLASAEELRAARLACQGAGGQASWYAAATKPEVAARNAAHSAQAGAAAIGSEPAELLAQAELLRDIFDPFRRLSVERVWLTPVVVQLANAIYQDRAFERMRELADALAEAGCDNEQILNHCRRAGPHVRGCLVLDLVLGKG